MGYSAVLALWGLCAGVMIVPARGQAGYGEATQLYTNEQTFKVGESNVESDYTTPHNWPELFSTTLDRTPASPNGRYYAYGDVPDPTDGMEGWAWTVPRLSEDEGFSTHLINLGDSFTSPKGRAFHRFTMVTDSNYKLGFNVEISRMDTQTLTGLAGGVQVTPLTGVQVYLRKYTKYDDLLIPYSQAAAGAVSYLQSATDYRDNVLNGGNPGTVLLSKQVDYGNATAFSVPVVQDTSSTSQRCMQQWSNDPAPSSTGKVYLTLDLVVPDALVGTTAPPAFGTRNVDPTCVDGDTLCVKTFEFEIKVDINWEDSRLEPSTHTAVDVSQQLYTRPVVELPRVLVKDLQTIIDTASDGNKATCTVTFSRPPAEDHVTEYHIIMVEPSQVGASLVATPRMPDTGYNIGTLRTVAKTSGTAAYTYQINEQDYNYAFFYVWVYAANAAGRDKLGVVSNKVAIAARRRKDARMHVVRLNNDMMKDRVQFPRKWTNPRTEAKSSVSRVHSARRKYTLSNITARLPGSGYSYRRYIQGVLDGDTSPRHQFTARMSNMSKYKLTVTSNYAPTNSPPRAISGVLVMANTHNKCPGRNTQTVTTDAGMSLTEIEQLAIDNPDVWWARLDCGTALSSTAGTGAQVTHTLGTSCSVSATNVFTFQVDCTSVSESITDITVVVVGSDNTRGEYSLDWESKDYHDLTTVQIDGSVLINKDPADAADFSQWATDVGTGVSSWLTTEIAPDASSPSLVTTSNHQNSNSSSTFSCDFVVAYDSSSTTSPSPGTLDAVAIAIEQGFQQRAMTSPLTIGTATYSNVSILTRPAVVVNGCMEPGDHRTLAIAHQGGCQHPIAKINMNTSMQNVRGLYLNRNSEPNQANYQVTAVYPATAAAAQIHECSSTQGYSTGTGTWYAQVFLLPTDCASDLATSSSTCPVPNVMEFQAKLSLNPAGGLSSGSQEGFVCCDQLMLYRFNVPANQQFKVGLAAVAPGALEALFLQKGSCPVGEMVLCTSANNCEYRNAPTSGSTTYEITTSRSTVVDTDTEWCVGVKAKAYTPGATDNAVHYTLVNQPVPTPTPVEPSSPPYYECTAQDVFCRRTYRLPNSATQHRPVLALTIAAVLSMLAKHR